MSVLSNFLTKHLIIICFNFKDAYNASGKTHVVDNYQLSTTVYYPPPCYDRKFLVKGITPETSTDMLINFLEAKTGIKVLTLSYHEDEDDIMMVTCEKQPGNPLDICEFMIFIS